MRADYDLEEMVFRGMHDNRLYKMQELGIWVCSTGSKERRLEIRKGTLMLEFARYHRRAFVINDPLVSLWWHGK